MSKENETALHWRFSEVRMHWCFRAVEVLLNCEIMLSKFLPMLTITDLQPWKAASRVT